MKKKIFLLFISILLFGISNSQKQLVRVGDELVLQEKQIPIAEFDSLPADVSAANVKFAVDNPGKPFEVSRRDFKTWYNHGLMFQSGEISTTRTYTNQKFTMPIDNKIVLVDRVSYGTYIFIVLALIGFFWLGVARIYRRSEISILLTALLVIGAGLIGGVFGIVVAIISTLILHINQSIKGGDLPTYSSDLLSADIEPFGESSRFSSINLIGFLLLLVSLSWLSHVAIYAETYKLLLNVFGAGICLFTCGRIIRMRNNSFNDLRNTFYDKLNGVVSSIYNGGDEKDDDEHSFTLFLAPVKYMWSENDCTKLTRGGKANGWNIVSSPKDNGFEFHVSPL